MRAYALMLGLLTMLVAPMVVDAAPARLDDADLVVVLPATSRREARQMSRALAPWARRVRRQYRATHRRLNLEGSARLRMSYVSLSSVVGDGATSPPVAQQLRLYLRNRFTSRPTTTERPRYLGIDRKSG